MHRRRRKPLHSILPLLAASALALPHAAAQNNCIPLTGSSSCPAFSSSSISTAPYLISLFPFLSSVNDVTSFDTGLQSYVSDGYVSSHYVTLFGCSGIDLANTTAVYARYTMSFICNAIVQNSISTCGLSTADSRPLCADSCAEFALSEQTIISTPDICGTPGSYALTQLRADFTNCALPADSITGTCVPAYTNEAANCGFQNNLEGLCTYCNSSTVNSTDSCCLESNVGSRCQDVHLPAFTTMQPLFTSTTAGASSPTAASAASSAPTAPTTPRHGLSGGQIAGIVVGSVLGLLLILALLICCGILLRRRKKRQTEKDMMAGAAPAAVARSPQRVQPMTQRSREPQAPPGGRVMGMAALEASSGTSPLTGTTPSSDGNGQYHSSPESGIFGIPGAAGVAAIPLRREHDRYDGSSPEGGTVSSPEESNESEQMEAFTDYYSEGPIRPGDLVSVLWAYSPRASDEFELERGDMLKVTGIWDDGWATGIRVNQRAEDWDRSTQRDSVVSRRSAGHGSPEGGQVKAFPMVCICRPDHWRKAIEGDSSATEEPRTSEEDRPPS